MSPVTRYVEEVQCSIEKVDFRISFAERTFYASPIKFKYYKKFKLV